MKPTLTLMTPIPPGSGPDSPHYGKRTDKGMRWISLGFWKRSSEQKSERCSCFQA